MKRALAILLVPLAVACARSEAKAPASEPAAAVASPAAPAKPGAAKKLTLLVSGDVGGKYAPCG